MSTKTVLITGASFGIGEATAWEFAKAGYNLILTARSLDKLEKMKGKIMAKYPVDIYLAQLDIRDKTQVMKVVENIPKTFRPIDVLINNAGLALGFEKLHEGNWDDWEVMIDTNVKGLLYMSRLIIPMMLANNAGLIINIGSIAGINAYSNGAVYCATKAAVKMLSEGMRIDLVDTPLRVSNIQPGLVETNFSKVRFHGDEERAKTVYQGLKVLKGEDIAKIALFLAELPSHVQVCEILVTPVNQATAGTVYRKQS